MRSPWLPSLLALVYCSVLTHRAYAGLATTAPDSVTGLYVPGWAENTGSVLNFFNTSAINLEGVSHVYYAFLWIYGGNSTVYDPFGNLKLLVSLKSRWPATKLILSIGGGGFSTTIWTKAATTGLTAFVNSAIKAMKSANADGIDLDWEYPVASTRDTFTALCAAMRLRLDAEGAAATPARHYWLTAATQSIVSGDSFDGYDLPVLKNHLDLFNIMTYTMHDPCFWETETHFHTAWAECATALDYYLSKGVPRTQLVLGLAFYGHVYRLTDPSVYKYPAPSVEGRDCSTMTTVSYRAILLELKNSNGRGGVFVDVAQRSAYFVYDTRWIGFDIPETMALKINASRAYGVGGVMIWDASLDTPDGSLLRAVASRNMSTTRPCGGGFVGNGACGDASLCCSEFGYCGLGETFCGPKCRGGPCIQYPSPPPRPPAPPPNCGNGVVGGGVCAVISECCSVAGWCGTGEAWCGVNCVGGPCWYKPRSPPPPPRPPPKPSPPPPPPLSYGCGEGIIGNGTCPFPYECCSAFGYCGTSDAHCGAHMRERQRGERAVRIPRRLLLQGATRSPPPPPLLPPPRPSASTFCGNGKVGNGTCRDPTQCCSAAGFCAVSADHCYWYCVGGPCWVPPPPPPAPPGMLASPSPPPPNPPGVVTVYCGDGVVGNKQCRLKNLCCSAAGFCAYSADHCLHYCVGGPCWAPPPSAVQKMMNATSSP
ncbi:hypothetical protein VOLCADRAFT_105813 [Volvox carteri f. nagariensis]|uniref:Chitinase n=1 Tax=Volvox carteri f. nagariensis TaxID=3068 RepID=D8U3A2_VOLCA|nr:uncharacterized protein VOLCADRAFT_105813 [Volvox carteri f. nagariensis]EFJ45717.1 hypothetical protein VOLCADRAFT_105813 [Volvox carteri f. nagariensis]|eukprot:XP_002953118.1 hypothetical protein VOLCADRAFT_105813 [Volvox carteri f. nagariensis]